MGKKEINESGSKLSKQVIVGYALSGGWRDRVYYSTDVVIDEQLVSQSECGQTFFADRTSGSFYPIDVEFEGSLPVCSLRDKKRYYLPPNVLLEIVVET